MHVHLRVCLLREGERGEKKPQKHTVKEWEERIVLFKSLHFCANEKKTRKWTEFNEDKDDDDDDDDASDHQRNAQIPHKLKPPAFTTIITTASFISS